MQFDKWAIRFFAVFLIVGPLWLVFAFLKDLPVRVLARDSSQLKVLPLYLLYVFSIYVGFRLWRGGKTAYWLALITYLSQIPYIAVDRLVMNWSTGVTVPFFMHLNDGDIAFHIKFEIGSWATFFVVSPLSETIIGMNLLAILACVVIYRVMHTRARATPASA
jgi:hypothetical protein